MPEIRDGFARRLRARHTTSLDASHDAYDSRAMQLHDASSARVESSRVRIGRGPRRAQPGGGVRPRVIFGVATALGFFAGFQAYYYVATFTEWPASLPFPGL